MASRWYPARRAPFRSPVPKLQSHAKQLKTILETAHLPLSRLWTDALVVLPAPDAVLLDNTPVQRDAKATVTLADLIGRLADAKRVPVSSGRFDTDISAHHEVIVDTVRGASRAPSETAEVRQLGGDRAAQRVPAFRGRRRPGRVSSQERPDGAGLGHRSGSRSARLTSTHPRLSSCGNKSGSESPMRHWASCPRTRISSG